MTCCKLEWLFGSQWQMVLISWRARIGHICRHKLVIAMQLTHHLILGHHLCAPIQAWRSRELTYTTTWVLFLVPLDASCATPLTTYFLTRSNVCLRSSLSQPFLAVNWRIWLWSDLFDVLGRVESAACIVIIGRLFRAHVQITVHELAACLRTQNFIRIGCVG